MYTQHNYRSKKELKAAVARRNELAQVSAITGSLTSAEKIELGSLTHQLMVYAPGIGEPKRDGTEFLEGPHYPEPHRWYAQATMKDGVIVKVS